MPDLADLIGTIGGSVLGTKKDSSRDFSGRFDPDSYKASFGSGAKACLFFCQFQIPDAGANSGSKGLMNSLGSLLGNATAGNFAKNVINGVMPMLGMSPGKTESELIPYLVKTANIPNIAFEERTVDYQGHIVKLPGSKTYGDWTISFNIDRKATIINSLHNWHTLIMEPGGQLNGTTSPKLFSDQKMFILDYGGKSISSVTFFGTFPKEIGEISFDYASNEYLTMNVTFAYQYYKFSSTPATSSTMDSLIKSGMDKLGTATGLKDKLGGLF